MNFSEKDATVWANMKLENLLLKDWVSHQLNLEPKFKNQLINKARIEFRKQKFFSFSESMMMMNISYRFHALNLIQKNIVYYFPPHSLNLNLCAQHIWRMMMRKTKKRTHHAIANIAEKNSRWWFLVQKVFKVSEFNWNEGKKQELQFVGTPHHHWGSFSHQASEWVSK